MDEMEQMPAPENADAEEKEEKKEDRFWYEWVYSLAAAVLIISLTFTFVVRMMGVEGGSMIPTLQDGDRLVVVDALLCGEYRQGDIVIAQKDSFSPKPIVKRVIAVAGQEVDIDFASGTVYVDGEALQEDYINEPTYLEEGTVFPLIVPEGSVLLLGDNRNHSTDSRYPAIGTVDTRYLIGKAKMLVFPGKDSETGDRHFSRIGLLHRPSAEEQTEQEG